MASRIALLLLTLCKSFLTVPVCSATPYRNSSAMLGLRPTSLERYAHWRQELRVLREKRAAFVLLSLICFNFPFSLQKFFGFCAIKFEEKILSFTSNCEGSVAWEAVELLTTSALVIWILKGGSILLRV